LRRGEPRDGVSGDQAKREVRKKGGLGLTSVRPRDAREVEGIEVSVEVEGVAGVGDA